MSPLPSCLKSLFESEAKGKAIDLKMILYSYANKTRFHKKGCALSLVLKVRVFFENGLFASKKHWPIH